LAGVTPDLDSRGFVELGPQIMIYAPEIEISLLSNSRKQVALQHEADRGKGSVTTWEEAQPSQLVL